MASSRVSRPLQQVLQSAGPRSARCYSTRTGYQLACCHHQRASRTRQPQRRNLSTATDTGGLRSILKVSEEVAEAVATNKPVVALESTIYTHGFLGNDLAREHEELVRSYGGIPAIIAIVDGVPKVGVSPKEILRMIEEPGTVKASRRDIAYLTGLGLSGRKIHGGTTIAGTMVLARLAGIRIFGTGGLGGVHRGGENSMDVSADLTELGRTRVAVVSSGCKGFLDIPRTLEFLETQGCLVSTFADGRDPKGRIDFPAFWARDSGIKSPSVVADEAEAAAIVFAQEKLGIESGIHFANPIPAEAGIPAAKMSDAIEQSVREAAEKGFNGSSNTPFILSRLRELLGEQVVVANKALVKSNIIRATNIATELSKLLVGGNGSTSSFMPVSRATSEAVKPPMISQAADILVAGSVALDLSCDYTSSKAGDFAPQAHTSNPASISQSIGGVGHNVALAAHSVSSKARVKFCSMVGDDVAGSTVLSALEASGLDTSSFRKLGKDTTPPGRTAQYVAVNDGNKNLVMAMADMNIFSDHSFPEHWQSTLQATKPRWLVVDGNWGAGDVRSWVKAGNMVDGCKVAFEPVSAEKSKRLFCPQRGQPSLEMFPRQSVNLATPNTYELAAMYAEAKENGYLDSPEWFDIIDSFGMTGARQKFVYLTSAELTDAGVPIQSVQLLPYIPTIITKLGSKGVLLTMLLGRDDPRLRERDHEQYILVRARSDHPTVGGIYMRMYEPAEVVSDVVSVNGVGDTFLGVLVSGMAQGGRVDRLIDVGQKGAVMTLRSAESVSPKLSALGEELSQAALLR